MDTTTDLKALARLLAEKEYPIAPDTSVSSQTLQRVCQEIHERAILPFLELLVEGNSHMSHERDCLKTLSIVGVYDYESTCTCGLSAHLDKIKAILDQH